MTDEWMRSTDVWELPTITFRKYRTSKYFPGHFSYAIMPQAKDSTYHTLPWHDREEPQDRKYGYACGERARRANPPFLAW